MFFTGFQVTLNEFREPTTLTEVLSTVSGITTISPEAVSTKLNYMFEPFFNTVVNLK